MDTAIPILFTDATWQACYAAWLTSMYQRSESETTVISCLARTKQVFTDASKTPDQYTRTEIDAAISHVNRKTGQPIASGTRNTRLAVLASFYEFASTYHREDGTLLLQTPAPTIGFTYSKPTVRYKYLTYEEVKAFFAAIPKDTVQGLRDRAIFLFYFWTLRRRTEIAEMSWGDIEETTVAGSDGKPRKAYMYHFYGKGRRGVRDTAELSVWAYNALVEYLKVSGRYSMMEPDSPLFVSTRQRVRDGRLSKSQINHLVKFYARKAGLDPARVSVHMWRHTGARERVRVGEDYRSLQRTMRHQSLATTANYLSLLFGEADETLEKLAAEYQGL